MNYLDGKKGWVEVICGPMFAGKTEELIRRVKRMDYAKKNYAIFKPVIDNRYSFCEVVSHSKRKVSATPISKPYEILELISKEVQCVVIDEVQFFDKSMLEVIDKLVNQGIRVICAGLDTDFRGIPFGIIGDVLAISESVTKLTAICAVCGEDATKTQRIIDGKPAYFDDETVLVASNESYEPRCRCHHEVLFK